MEEAQVKTQLFIIFPSKISSWCASNDDIAGAAAAAAAAAAAIATAAVTAASPTSVTSPWTATTMRFLTDK